MSRAATDSEIRQARIVEIARDSGSVSVDGLAAMFGVTPQTIRKDLALLDRRALIARVHGGAGRDLGHRQSLLRRTPRHRRRGKGRDRRGGGGARPRWQQPVHQHRHDDGGDRAPPSSIGAG